MEMVRCSLTNEYNIYSLYFNFFIENETRVNLRVRVIRHHSGTNETGEFMNSQQYQTNDDCNETRNDGDCVRPCMYVS